ncbi:unnamed protein product [Peniophora sp. CBMAI 1063]|nr:unnamed protein product [Peniophora sp. CBMAI 1063]
MFTPASRQQGLVRRFGSVSAPDPYAQQHIVVERQESSRLTIVRVQPEDSARLYGPEPDQLSRSTHGTLVSPPTKSPRGSPRLSFASTTFSQQPPSPTRSLREVRGRSGSASRAAQMRPVSLTPQEVLDLAETSVHPSAASTAASSRRRSRSPTMFIPVPEKQLLPFLDRPSEVAAFIAAPPTSRLMALLEQAFPAHQRIRPPRSPSAPPPYTPSRSQSFADELASALAVYAERPRASFEDDPAQWSYAVLVEWMCTVPREAADDVAWIKKIRTCVMAHSEQICVALLSALGVPMGGFDEGNEDEEVEVEEDVLAPLPIHARRQTPTPTPTPVGRDFDSPSTVLGDVLDVDDDAFHLSVSEIIAPLPDTTQIYAIGESDESQSSSESEDELVVRRRRVGSGASTPRARSPRYDSTSSSSDPDTPASPPPVHRSLLGLIFEAHPRATGDVRVLPSLRGPTSFPAPVSSSLPPVPVKGKRKLRVAHVLSGAPGHAGYTWRPGGPLFARSFGGRGGENSDSEFEGEKVPPLLPKAVFDIKRPSIRQRSKSRETVRRLKDAKMIVPPNTPVSGVIELLPQLPASI